MKSYFSRTLALVFLTGLTVHGTTECGKKRPRQKQQQTQSPPKKRIKIERKQKSKKVKEEAVKQQEKKDANSWWQPVTRIFEKQETETIAKEFRTKGEHVALTNIHGNVTIRTWPYEKVVVELNKKGHRDDLENTHVITDVTPQKVSITTKVRNKDLATATTNYSIIVPEKAEVTIKTEQGDITLCDIHSAVDAQTMNGSIHVKQCRHTINARAPQGSITVQQDKLYPYSSIFLQAYNGIRLAIPTKTNAALTARNTQGVIISNMYVTLNPITTKLDRTFWKRIKHEISGTIGSGASAHAVPIILENVKKPIEIIAV